MDNDEFFTLKSNFIIFKIFKIKMNLRYLFCIIFFFFFFFFLNKKIKRIILNIIKIK